MIVGSSHRRRSAKFSSGKAEVFFRVNNFSIAYQPFSKSVNYF